MGKRGPKPKPSAVRLLSGTTAGDVAAPARPGPLAEPECPGHLDDVARAEWKRMIPILTEAGTLARVDGPALALYCSAYSRWVAASELLAAGDGLTEVTGHGGLKVSPYVQIAQQAEAMMHRMLSEFGATPASRARVSVPAEAPKDAFTEFLAKRKA